MQMAKYEAHLKTTVGEVVINFDSADDLKKNIESLDLNAVSDIISTKFGSILVKEPLTSEARIRIHLQIYS